MTKASAEDPIDLASAAAFTLKVLEAFTPLFPELSEEEIAHRSGVPKSLAHKLTRALAKQGYLRLDTPSNRYRLGASLIGLARNFLGGRGVRALARGHMEALAIRFMAPVALTERDGLEMVYLEYVRADAPVIVQYRVGTRLPLVSTAAGRAWIASAPPVEAQAVATQLAAQLQGEWPAVQRKFETARTDLGSMGFTRSYGDLRPDVNAVAVPLTSPVDGSLMVFSLAAPAVAVDAARFDKELGPALVATVSVVRAELEQAGRSAGQAL
jgi:DNA-binding IclR family transcriptional regulator